LVDSEACVLTVLAQAAGMKRGNALEKAVR
jgi:hypothetical protein